MTKKIALITGASSGIGEEFARRVAGRGYDIVVVARREERLKALAYDIERKSNVKVTVVPADLSTDTGIATVEACIEKLPRLDLLINNAGFGYGGLFSEMPLKPIVDMLQVHIMATVRLTYKAVERMKAQKSGAIINLGSTAAFVPVPGSATYPASKSFIVSFTESLRYDLKNYGITLQVLCPGFTYSEFHDSPAFAKFKRSILPSFMWMKADAVVAGSLRALDRKQVVYIAGFMNRMMIAMLKFPVLPRLLWNAIAKYKKIET